MSGGQIGTVVGGAIGAYFGAGNPAAIQLGMAIGGAIGGAIDPTKINGPKIGDGQTQSATDGTPIAWVMGTATVAGTLVQVSPRRQVKIKDSGKGGPVVSHYEARQDFAILVCESCELRDSTIDAVIMVQQDGKIVYDVRPRSVTGRSVADHIKMTIASSKWKQNVKFMFGDEAQLPNSTLEAITGVGNTPSYRGSCTSVFSDFNVTAAGDRIPAFSFTVTSAATENVTDNVLDDYSFAVSGSLPAKDQLAVQGFESVIALPSEAIGVYQVTYSSWAFTKTWFTGLPDAQPDSNTPIPSSESVDAMGGSADFDTGWVWYYGDAIPVDSRVHDWFSSKGLPDPVTTPLGTPPVTVSASSVAINAIKVKMLVFSGAFNWSTTGLSIKLALTGGRNLQPIGGGYYVDADTGMIWRPSWVAPFAFSRTYNPETLTLADIVTRICVRGGLTIGDVDAADLASIVVSGYPIARQGNALDMLGPLLQAYFCYASEYDGRIHFKRYGADALVTISDDDLLEATDANDNNVTSTTRNQATEFPRKITASYMDPQQNYMSVTVTAERLAVDVTAIGEQTLSIPVGMPADQAKQAAEKALKVTYATLEGKQEYSIPFAGKGGTYLSICAGEPIIFRGKRWVVDEAIMGNGYMKLSTRYDRQSAYTSTVQAIVGNAPSTPSSPYSGPTRLIAMNLPSLRPQDTYGLYLAANAASSVQNWRGCTVQVSYDGKVTWQNAMQITQGATFGIVADDEPIGSEPLTVKVNGDLSTVTDAQISALGNAFAAVHATGTEVGQFKTATEDALIADKYELTDVTRGGLGTTQSTCAAGEVFVMLDSVYFLPIDTSFAGKTIYLRGIGFGESAEDASVVAIVYQPDTTIIHDGGLIT